ncbi:MAG: molecular chaperone TorD family protein [Alphaproteobacteria bacterium]|nr:molecular chaperone TorD family protein [Alphaproteobacteria bacterium]
MTAAPAPAIDAEDRLRADLYDYLAVLLTAPPDQALLDRTAGLTGDASRLGQAIEQLAQAARGTTPQAVTREFNALFIGVGRGELLPYASYYLTGFLNDKPLARLRGDMAKLGIARSERTSDPEDNIASLLEMMAGLIIGRFGQSAGADVQQDFFDKHIGPWADRFMTDLTQAEAADVYTNVGALGLAFMEIEREAFRLTS